MRLWKSLQRGPSQSSNQQLVRISRSPTRVGTRIASECCARSSTDFSALLSALCLSVALSLSLSPLSIQFDWPSRECRKQTKLDSIRERLGSLLEQSELQHYFEREQDVLLSAWLAPRMKSEESRTERDVEDTHVARYLRHSKPHS